LYGHFENSALLSKKVATTTNKIQAAHVPAEFDLSDFSLAYLNKVKM